MDKKNNQNKKPITKAAQAAEKAAREAAGQARVEALAKKRAFDALPYGKKLEMEKAAQAAFEAAIAALPENASLEAFEACIQQAFGGGKFLGSETFKITSHSRPFLSEGGGIGEFCGVYVTYSWEIPPLATAWSRIVSVAVQLSVQVERPEWVGVVPTRLVYKDHGKRSLETEVDSFLKKVGPYRNGMDWLEVRSRKPDPDPDRGGDGDAYGFSESWGGN